MTSVSPCPPPVSEDALLAQVVLPPSPRALGPRGPRHPLPPPDLPAGALTPPLFGLTRTLFAGYGIRRWDQ